MINFIVKFSVERRWLVLFITLLIVGVGAYNVFQLNIDAVPDITNVQVQINTEAEGYSPLEVEQRITYSVENAMAGLPNLDYTVLYHAMGYLKSLWCLKKIRIFILPDN